MLQFTRLADLPVNEVVGDIKYFASQELDAPLRDQFNAAYSMVSFGGGWNPIEGFEMLEDKSLKYPEDPPLKPLAVASFRNQKVYAYSYEFVAIVEEDGTFEVSRMD